VEREVNFLGLVFSLLLIFSFGTLVLLEAEWGDRRLHSTYLGYVSANRKLFAQYEQQNYRSISGTLALSSSTGKSKTPSSQPKIVSQVRINPECARLNLWPLLQEEDPNLYAMTLQLLESCYSSFFSQEDLKKAPLFLKAFVKELKRAHAQGAVCLEKLNLGLSFHKMYYAMLKGTKEWDPYLKVGYPSLLDLVKVEENPSKLCLAHAHSGVCMALFGPKVGALFYEKVHQEPTAVRSLEWMEQIYLSAHQLMGNEKMFELLELNNTIHRKNKKITLVADDPDLHVSLRKTLRL